MGGAMARFAMATLAWGEMGWKPPRSKPLIAAVKSCYGCGMTYIVAVLIVKSALFAVLWPWVVKVSSPRKPRL